jgi:sulfide:quinone oxidoreductase
LTRTKNILILGAGFGGLASANLLRKNLPREHQITIIDKNPYFMMGLVNLWVLSGTRTLEDSRVALNKLENKGIRFLNDEIIGLDLSRNSVETKSSHNLEYDYLILALGAELAPERINGFIDSGGFNLYDVRQIPKLREEILSLKRGSIVICVADNPYKCPPAPYEASLLINEILVKNGTRDSIDLGIYVPTPIALPVAGTKISQDVVDLLNNNHIKFYPLHKLKTVLNKEIEFENGKRINYDLLITIPPHQVPQIVKKSDLLRDTRQNWIIVDRFTLRTKYKYVFAIGDITEIRLDQNMTIPKAGIFAEREAKVVSQQIINEITNNDKEAHAPKFDGKGFCFMEIGNKNAGYIDADFYNEAGPITRLESPSEESYQRKVDFERSRISDWLL